MSDLEELGLIEQPHTSAGRIPSQKGYRLYVDSMMRSRELTSDELKFLRSAISFNVGQIDYLMQQTAKALAMLTSYTTVITEPQSKRISVMRIQLVPIDDRSVVCVIITEDKTVKNVVIQCEKAPDAIKLAEISQSINDTLAGKDFSQPDKLKTAALLDKYPDNKGFITNIIKAVVNTVVRSGDVHMYTSGVRNLLGFPEFSDIEKAKSIFRALEEKEMLITLLGDEGASDKVQIVIGGENNMEELKNCSIVKASYKVGNNSYGKIGIIGPTRMNYSQTVSVLSSIIRKMDSVLSGMMENGGYDGQGQGKT